MWYKAFGNTVTSAKSCAAYSVLPSALNQAGATLFPNTDYVNLDPDQIRLVQAPAEEITLATIYLERANKSRYSKLVQKLENDHLLRQNNYPTTLAGAQKLLLNYQTDDPVNRFRMNSPGGDSVAYNNNGEYRSNRLC